MTTMMKILAGGAGLAALAATAPASAQYTNPPYGYASPYGAPYGYASPYGAPYGNAYGYHANAAQFAAQRCSAAVQARLSQRTRANMGGIVGALLGVNTAAQGRVLSITEVRPRSSTVRVRGLATSGRMAGYGPYGVGAYGALGYQYQPDLKFKCDVDYRGYIRDIDIDRR
ncbi:MAG TPA: hypothetical protein VFK58_08275 [Sphingomicrobium sp.]|nr:hypothetical protein [Sphingomicrobium sp.]